MTTTLFIILLIIGSVVLFFVSAILLANIFDDANAGFVCAFVIVLLFNFGFCILAPSMEQMIENDYYAMLYDRPECIDASHVSLGCKKDYIKWQRDSIEKQYKYDSVKVLLDNEQKEILK